MYLKYADGHVRSVGGEAIGDPAAARPDAWYGLEGTVRTSGDWALLREDGVLMLDSRFTIEATDGSHVCVFLMGRADLARAYETDGAAAYDAWVNERPPRHKRIPLSASLRFDVPGAPHEWEDTASKRLRAASQFHWKYTRLGRQCFVGAGEVVLDAGRAAPDTGFASGLELSVFELGAG